MNNYYSQHKTTKLRSKALDSNLTISLKIKWNYKILLNTSKKKKLYKLRYEPWVQMRSFNIIKSTNYPQINEIPVKIPLG